MIISDRSCLNQVSVFWRDANVGVRVIRLTFCESRAFVATNAAQLEWAWRATWRRSAARVTR